MDGYPVKKTIVMTLCLAIIIGIFTLTVYAASGSSREYHLKAAFLRYVAKFVEWPENSIPESSVNICVYGELPSLKGINSINGRVVNDRSIVIRTLLKLDDAEKECQILYLAKDRNDELESIVEKFSKKPILTFGDMEGFAEIGGDMNFYIVNNRMAIKINQEAVKESNLKIHPRMLRLVTITPSEDDVQG